MDELIQRQAAIDIFDKWLSYGDYNYSERNIMNCAIAEIKELPSCEVTDVLNKIRAEILLRDTNVKAVRTDGCCFFTTEEIFEIIDKHIAEGNEKNE